MHQIKYEGVVKFRDFDNSLKSRKYSFFASNEDDANNIVRELFFMDSGVAEDMNICCRAIDLPYDKVELVRNKLIKVLSSLDKLFSTMTYKGFLQSFLNFEGSHFRLTEESVSYVLTFRKLSCQVVFQSGVVSINRNELIYRLEDIDGGHVMVVVRDNLSRYFIGEG